MNVEGDYYLSTAGIFQFSVRQFEATLEGERQHKLLFVVSRCLPNPNHLWPQGRGLPWILQPPRSGGSSLNSIPKAKLEPPDGGGTNNRSAVSCGRLCPA